MEREAQQKQLKLSAPEKTDKNPNRKIHHLPPLVLLQLNAYILSFHYNWNLVLMEVVFGHYKTRLCLAIAFYSNAKDGVKYFKSLCPGNSTKCVCYFGEKFNRFYQSCINWKFNLLLTVCRFLPRSILLSMLFFRVLDLN